MRGKGREEEGGEGRGEGRGGERRRGEENGGEWRPFWKCGRGGFLP